MLLNSQASQNSSSLHNPALQTPPIFQNPPIGGTYTRVDWTIHALKEQLGSQQQTLAQMMSQIQAQKLIIQTQGQMFQNQLSQLCKGLSQGQNTDLNHRGQLLSQLVANPKHDPPGFSHPLNNSMAQNQASSSQGTQMEELKGVTKLRNGKVISKPDLEPLDSEIPEEEDDDTKENSPTVEEVKYEPPILFPSALFPKTRNNKKNVEDKDLIKLFEQVHINIALLDAIKHVPSYAKFLKSLCTPKRETKKVNLSSEVSAFILIEMPKKRKDPVSPLVSCSI